MDKKEFENDLLSGNITEKYLNMPKEELEKNFGSEFMKSVNFGNQNNNHHQYELFEHLLRTVDNVKSETLSQEELLKIKVAAFFHDIGKPDVAQLNEKTGQTQFIGHAKLSAEISKSILENLEYSSNEINEIQFLIESHDDFIQINKMEDITQDRISKALATRIKKSENYKPTISDFKKLITLCKADAMAQAEVIEKEGVVIDTQKDRIDRLNAIEEIMPEAIILNQNKEIEKLNKQKADIDKEPAPIEKNGKIVNQKQIDIWKAMSEEEKQNKKDELSEKISNLENEKNELLELNEVNINFEINEFGEIIRENNNSDENKDIHMEKANKLEKTALKKRKLEEEFSELENKKEK